MAEILPEDAGVIRCICEYDHDDNFTIQCERCNAWQHAKCVDIADENSVPENYLCPECNDQTNSVDRGRARANQKLFLQQKLEMERLLVRNKNGDEGHQEDRRRRGGRKRNSSVETSDRVNESDAVPQPFSSKYYGIPATESVWTDKARRLWTSVAQRLSSTPPLTDIPNELLPPVLVSSKELKSQPQLRVIRHNSAHDKWEFGIQAGAVVPTTNLGTNKLVCEVTGEVMLRSEYCEEPINQFHRLGCPKPGVMFVPGFPLAVDTRRRGSQTALFLRRSSEPNVRLVARRDMKNELRILVYTRKPVKAGVELSLGWHWPADHPITLALAAANSSAANASRSENMSSVKKPNSKTQEKASNGEDLIKPILWLLDTDLESCAPVENEVGEEDEDWEVSLSSGTHDCGRARLLNAPPRRPRRAEELARERQITANAKDPGTALAINVWIPAPQKLPPPPKKRMSLKDYMKKRV